MVPKGLYYTKCIAYTINSIDFLKILKLEQINLRVLYAAIQYIVYKLLIKTNQAMSFHWQTYIYMYVESIQMYIYALEICGFYYELYNVEDQFIIIHMSLSQSQTVLDISDR